MHPTAQLPFLPLSLHTLSEAPFFASGDPCVVRAGFYMLEAAWRSSRPGSIPSSFSELATITRLAVDKVEQHYGVLTAGWELLEDGRLHHAQLEVICDSIRERFADQLSVIADSAVVAVQGGCVPFELMPSAEVVKKKRGKHLMPHDFALDKTTLSFATSEGFNTQEFQAWLMRSFADYARSKNVMYTNWQAACRQFIGSDITRKQFCSRFHHFPGEAAPSLMAPNLSVSDRLRAAAAGSFHQRTMQNNSDKMHGLNRFMSGETTASAPKQAFSRHVDDVSDADFSMQHSAPEMQG